jgi:hypothetical protein
MLSQTASDAVIVSFTWAVELGEHCYLAGSTDCALSSHRGGQGFKSPQLHPNQQVRAMIFGLDDHAKDHLTVARPSW